MRYIKKYEGVYKPTMGDYVKVREDSPFFSLGKNKIFKIQREDNIEYYLTDIYGKYDPIFFNISKFHMRELTLQEHRELELLLNQNKYNL